MSNSNECDKDLNELKVNELRNELEKRGLDKTGVKSVLVERLEHAIKTEGCDSSTFKFIIQETDDDLKIIDGQECKDDASKNAIAHIQGSESVNGESEIKDASAAVVKEDEKMDFDESTKIEDEEQQQESDVPIPQCEQNTPDLSSSSSSERQDKQTTGNNKVVAGEQDVLTIDEDVQIKKTTQSSVQPQKAPSTNTTNQSSQKDLSCSLWVRNITTATKAADLKALFSKHGKVITAKIFTTKNKLSPTCFGYVTLANMEIAELCIQKLNRMNFKGRVISVEKADRSNLSQINKAASTQGQQPKETKTTTPSKTSKTAKLDTNKPDTKPKAKESTSSSTKQSERPKIKAAKYSTKESPSKWRTSSSSSYGNRDRYPSTNQSRLSSTHVSYGHKSLPVVHQYPQRRVIQTSRGVHITTDALPSYASHVSRAPEPVDYRTIHHHAPSRRSRSPTEKDEMLRLMRRREEEHRKKEEELRLEREREKIKYEREKLEREKLELETLKLQAQLAQAAHFAAIPSALANPATALLGSTSSAVHQYIAQNQRHDTSSSRRNEAPTDDRKTTRRHLSKERETTTSRHHSTNVTHSRMSSSRGQPNSDNRTSRRTEAERRSRSPLRRSEPSRGNDRRAAAPRDSKYELKKNDDSQKRIGRSSTEMATGGTGAAPAQQFDQAYNRRGGGGGGYYAGGRNYPEQRQQQQHHASPLRPQQDHQSYRRTSPQARSKEFFQNGRVEHELAADSYAARTDPSYASRIGQAHQQQMSNRDLEFGNASYGLSAQRSVSTYGSQNFGREPQQSSNHGYFQNSIWDATEQRDPFVNTSANAWNSTDGNWNAYNNWTNPSSQQQSATGRIQSYGKGQGTSYAGGRRY